MAQTSVPPVGETPLERIRRLRAETEKQQHDRHLEAKYSRGARVREDIATTGRFTYQVGVALAWVHRHFFRRIAHWGVWLWRLIIHGYARFWAFVVYRRTEDNVLVFSKSRAGGMLLATGIFVWYLALPLAGCIYDTGLYVLTVQHDEHLYLFGSQEIDPDTGTHNIEGAAYQPWSEQDSIYFRAENSLFANLWSILHKGGLYYPEYVGAAVPYGTSRCIVTSYGVRIRVWFLKNTYSYLLSVSCVPLGDDRPLPQEKH